MPEQGGEAKKYDPWYEVHTGNVKSILLLEWLLRHVKRGPPAGGELLSPTEGHADRGELPVLCALLIAPSLTSDEPVNGV